jgi:predicted 3-demethylubiquinone-9 3-methyltransferase (glyoxalase superfamily)
MAKNTICLWYDKDAEAAARFYALGRSPTPSRRMNGIDHTSPKP